METSSISHLDLPGFRFHPTEEELLDFYLRRALHGNKLIVDIIGTLNLYKYEPWDLPGMAKTGEREWYFFVPRDRRQGGGRPNRTTERGFWKATGSDRPVRSAADPKRQLGLKKTLVYYQGRAPRGLKTDWVMNEYRLPDTNNPPKEDIVLCKVYRKATSLKELEQRAAMEESPSRAGAQSATPTPSTCAPNNNSNSSSASSTSECEEFMMDMVSIEEELRKEIEEVKKEVEVSSSTAPTAVKRGMLPELELQVTKQGMDWFLQDSCFRSPWMDLWSPYLNLLSFPGGSTGAELI